MNAEVTLKVAKFLSRRIKTGAEMIKEYPQYREEYLEETLGYSKILYQLLKDALL